MDILRVRFHQLEISGEDIHVVIDYASGVAISGIWEGTMDSWDGPSLCACIMINESINK